MALGTITVGSDKLLKASAPIKAFQLSFLGDSTYVKGTGTATFQALVRAAVAENVTVLGVVAAWSSTPKWQVYYDDASDALKILDVATGDEAINGTYVGVTFTCTVLAI